MGKTYTLILCCALMILPCAYSFDKRVILGGLFEAHDPCLNVFEKAVHAVNTQRYNSHELANVFFVSDLHIIDDNLFETTRNVCSLFEKRSAAIFGPSNVKSGEHVQSICDSVDVPNIIARWEMEPARMKAFNIYPHADILSKAFWRIVKDYHWSSYTILYDGSDSLASMNELLKKWGPKGYTVTIRSLGNGNDFRSILTAVRKSADVNIVIDCSYEILETVLRQCQQVGLMSDQYNIIVTNLDFHTLDLEPYQYSGVNLTGVRMVDVETHDPELTPVDNIETLRIGEALTYDAVQFFSRALKRASDVMKGNVQSVKCNGSDYWDYGLILNNYLRTTEMTGLTGLLKLDTHGFRTDFTLDIIHVDREGIKKIGRYNSTQHNSIKWQLNRTPSAFPSHEDDLSNMTFKILISIVKPYIMLTESSSTRSGNERYEGFAIDILKEISKELRFNYTLIETDPDYGREIDNSTHEWSGMLGKIKNGEADLAIADLTITAERESVVDFTMPFMNLGIGILYRKPTKAAPSLFAFLSPFSNQVWLYLFVSYILCSLLLFVIGRMSPKEWTNPYPCIEEPETLENQFTLKNSLWFMIGAIMQQGSEIAPIGISTRMLASAWWFFCLIIVSSYTANLAAFLVVETPVKMIKSAEDLVALNGAIKYGAKKAGATFNFFKTYSESEMYPPYEKMYKYMISNDVMTENNNQGVAKVLDANENYAFLMESSSIEYEVQRHCNLTQIGNLLDAKGYGIAMKKDWVHRHRFNNAVLKLQESGVISTLKTIWWEQKRDGGKCRGEQPSAASKLTLDHVGGVFLVLGFGVALSVPFAFWEMIWEIICTAYREKLSFKNELVEELNSIIKSKSSVKPARRRKESSRMVDSSTRGSTPAYAFNSIDLSSTEDI